MNRPKESGDESTTIPSHRGQRQSGFTLVETAMSALIVGILMAVALNTAGAATRSQRANGDAARSIHFASGLLAEVLEYPFENPDGTPVFGPEAGETSTTREKFDDVDDYHNWSSSPQSKDGIELANGVGLKTTVSVAFADPNNLANGAPAGGSTGAKRITVNVLRGSTLVATISAVVAR